MKNTAICLLNLVFHISANVASGQEVSSSIMQSVRNLVDRVTPISPQIPANLPKERSLMSPPIDSCSACYGGEDFTVADPDAIIPALNVSCTDIGSYIDYRASIDATFTSSSPDCVGLQFYTILFCGCPEAPPFDKQNCRLCSSGKDVPANYTNAILPFDLASEDPNQDIYLTCDQFDHYINFALNKTDPDCSDIQTYLGDSFCGCSNTVTPNKKKGKKGGEKGMKGGMKGIKGMKGKGKRLL